MTEQDLIILSFFDKEISRNMEDKDLTAEMISLGIGKNGASEYKFYTIIHILQSRGLLEQKKDVSKKGLYQATGKEGLVLSDKGLEVLNSQKKIIPHMGITSFKNEIMESRDRTTTTNNYYVNQAGAVGPNSSSQANTFNQLNEILPSDTNYEVLTNEIIKLKEILLLKAAGSEHYHAIGEIVKAKEASESKSGTMVIKHLKAAGKWALDVIKETTPKVLSEIIKSQFGN